MRSIPDRLRYDPDWAAAVIVLEAFAADDDRVWKHVHLPNQSDPMPRCDIDFDAMLIQEVFTQAEALLLLTAASLAEGGRFARTLDDEADLIDGETFDTGILRLVLRAVAASSRASVNGPDRPWVLRLGSGARVASS